MKNSDRVFRGLLFSSVVALLAVDAIHAQGPVPTSNINALDWANGNKVVVSAGELHMVYAEAGFVKYTMSIRGNPWINLTPISPAGLLCFEPVIAVDVNQTVAVAFLCGSGAQRSLYYTYKSLNAAWSVPQDWQLQGDWPDEPSLVAWDADIHLAWAETAVYHTVKYATFRTTAPPAILDSSTTETVDYGPTTCAGSASEKVSSVSIAVAPSLKVSTKLEVKVAFMQLHDCRNSSGTCQSNLVSNGVWVHRRDSPGNWASEWGDPESHSFIPGVHVETGLSNVSIAANRAGEFFVAYSDHFCTVFDLVNGCQSAIDRTKIAHAYPVGTTHWWNSFQLDSVFSQVDVAARNHPNNNVRVVWGCRFDSSGSCAQITRQDWSWHGTQAAVLVSGAVIDSVGADPQALFFSRGPGGCNIPGCDLDVIWTDTDHASGTRIVAEQDCLSFAPPILHYTFDNSSSRGHDDSGNNHLGTTYQTNMGVVGKDGSALRFHGKNNVVEFDTPSTLDLNLTGAMTGMAWIRPRGDHTPDSNPATCTTGTVFTKGGNYSLQVSQNNSALVFQNQSSGASIVTTSTPIPKNRWTQVAFVRGGNPTDTSQFRIYRDGSSRAFAGSLTSPLINGSPLSVGNGSNSGSCEFEGDIDEIKIYNFDCTNPEITAEYLSYDRGSNVWLDTNNTTMQIHGGFGFPEDPGPIAYDVIRGDLQMLRDTTGDFEQANTTCLESNTEGPLVDITETPPPGQGYWFLGRSVGIDYGGYTYNSLGLGQARPRDYTIALAMDACP